MFNFPLHWAGPTIFFMSQVALVTILVIVLVFFVILLCLGVIKSYKLQKENERLEAMNPQIEDETNKPYNDFTQSHMYDKN